MNGGPSGPKAAPGSSAARPPAAGRCGQRPRYAGGSGHPDAVPKRHRWDPVCDVPTDLVHPVRADPARIAGPTRHEAERAGRPGSEWRRVWQGLFVPSYVDPDVPEQRIVEASSLLTGPGAVTGWAALRMQRGNFFDGRDRDGGLQPVPIIVSQGRRPRPGIAWMQDRLAPSEVVHRAGVAVTRPERAAFDAMRRAGDVRAAVKVADMVCAAGLSSLRRMRQYASAHPGWAGCPIASAALNLASERSRSPAEVDLRLVWELDAGLPRPLVNVPVFTRHGRLLGIADLLDEEAGLVVEFDGADHAGARRRSKDAGREGGLRNHRLEVERATGFDLHDVPTLVRRLHSARRRAPWLAEGDRPWTLQPPPWWEPELSLDERLDLRDFERECDERGRAG